MNIDFLSTVLLDIVHQSDHISIIDIGGIIDIGWRL